MTASTKTGHRDRKIKGSHCAMVKISSGAPGWCGPPPPSRMLTATSITASTAAVTA
ncbi:MAG TPA: hypothetical protein VD859_16090 [Nocardioides sp.]|nr:hypothetical protein [Nocardioides sp.]